MTFVQFYQSSHYNHIGYKITYENGNNNDFYNIQYNKVNDKKFEKVMTRKFTIRRDTIFVYLSPSHKKSLLPIMIKKRDIKLIFLN